MAKPVLSKEQFQRGLVPQQFEVILQRGFQAGDQVVAFRDLLAMTQEHFASALGIPLTLLEEMESSSEPPSPKLQRRLMRAASEPGAFQAMT